MLNMKVKEKYLRELIEEYKLKGEWKVHFTITWF